MALIEISSKGQSLLGRSVMMPATVTLFSPPPLPSSPFFHLLKCFGGEISVLWSQKQSLARRDGIHGPLRPTTEKSIILFYSCAAISFFLNLYYSYTVKLSWKQPDSFGGWDTALRLPVCNTATLHWGTRALFLHLLTLHLTRCPCDSLLPTWLVVIFQLNVLKIKLFKQQWPATMLFGILP